HLFLAKTRWGRAIRATAEDWEAAALMGIPVGKTYLLAFALGTVLAGIAGGLVSVSYSISPSIGLEWTLKALIVVVLAGLGSLFTQRNDFLNLGVQIFLAVALAESWNLLGGYAGQITLGHAAFFGLGALVTRTLWVGGAPLFLALPAGALVATAFGVLIGAPAFRLRGAYFAIGTLALAGILRIPAGHLIPQISMIPLA